MAWEFEDWSRIGIGDGYELPNHRQLRAMRSHHEDYLKKLDDELAGISTYAEDSGESVRSWAERLAFQGGSLAKSEGEKSTHRKYDASGTSHSEMQEIREALDVHSEDLIEGYDESVEVLKFDPTSDVPKKPIRHRVNSKTDIKEMMRQDLRATPEINYESEDEIALPRNIKNLILRGMHEFLEKRYYSAARTFTEAMNADISGRLCTIRYSILTNRSAALMQLGHHQESLMDAMESLMLNPHTSRAFFSMGRVLYEMSRFDIAAREFLKGLKLSVNNQILADRFTETLSRLRKDRMFWNRVTKPRIVKIWPEKGSVFGGTQVYIDGYELGESMSGDSINLKHGQHAGSGRSITRVFIGGVECSNVLVLKQTRLVCDTPQCPGFAVGSYQVEVEVDGRRMPVKPGIRFKYELPVVTTIMPNVGPIVGGQRLYISGLYLGVDAEKIFVTLGPNRCTDLSVQTGNKLLVCTTPMGEEDNSTHSVTVHLSDNAGNEISSDDSPATQYTYGKDAVAKVKKEVVVEKKRPKRLKKVYDKKPGFDASFYRLLCKCHRIITAKEEEAAILKEKRERERRFEDRARRREELQQRIHEAEVKFEDTEEFIKMLEEIDEEERLDGGSPSPEVDPRSPSPNPEEGGEDNASSNRSPSPTIPQQGRRGSIISVVSVATQEVEDDIDEEELEMAQMLMDKTVHQFGRKLRYVFWHYCVCTSLVMEKNALGMTFNQFNKFAQDCLFVDTENTRALAESPLGLEDRDIMAQYDGLRDVFDSAWCESLDYGPDAESSVYLKTLQFDEFVVALCDICFRSYGNELKKDGLYALLERGLSDHVFPYGPSLHSHDPIVRAMFSKDMMNVTTNVKTNRKTKWLFESYGEKSFDAQGKIRIAVEFGGIRDLMSDYELVNKADPTGITQSKLEDAFLNAQVGGYAMRSCQCTGLCFCDEWEIRTEKPSMTYLRSDSKDVQGELDYNQFLEALFRLSLYHAGCTTFDPSPFHDWVMQDPERPLHLVYDRFVYTSIDRENKEKGGVDKVLEMREKQLEEERILEMLQSGAF